MKIISPANKTILQILNRFRKSSDNMRLVKYCVQTHVDEGVLLFNLMTRELILLSHEEFINYSTLEHLKANWFLVHENTNEKEIFNILKLLFKSKQSNFSEITGYSIFTTTDCNARCFYCFELGRSRIPMTQDTALKVVQYIKKNSKGQKVKINWFGGEPLLNPDVIDTICKGLQHEEIEFASRMITNGYLLDQATIEKADTLWNLTELQITLDGTEKVYNKIKSYVYPEGNPYEIVLNNIKQLLKTDIAVSIRLNMDLHNAADLLNLVDELAERFGGGNKLYVYACHIFKDETPNAEAHTTDEWDARELAMCQIEAKLEKSGLHPTSGIEKLFKPNRCMADSGKHITIHPDGKIGLCEVHDEKEYIGHIEREGFDDAAIASWREPVPEIPECDECFYYPECINLKKCKNSSICYPQFRSSILRKTQSKMKGEFEYWKRFNSL